MAHGISGKTFTLIQRILLAVVLVVAALGFMGATGDKDGHFDAVFDKTIYVKNSEGKTAILLGSSDKGGVVYVNNSQGEDAARLASHAPTSPFVRRVELEAAAAQRPAPHQARGHIAQRGTSPTSTPTPLDLIP